MQNLNVAYQMPHLELNSVFPRDWGIPYNDLYEESPPEKETFFRLQAYKRVSISQVGVYKRVEKSVI